MEYRHLGRTGLKVSTLSYGAWVTFGNQLDVKDAVSILSLCREAGVNFFDNAEVYADGKAEEIMGAAIKQAGWKRSDLVISTKLFWGGSGPNDKGLSRKHILEGTKVSPQFHLPSLSSLHLCNPLLFHHIRGPHFVHCLCLALKFSVAGLILSLEQTNDSEFAGGYKVIPLGMCKLEI